jgi:hypothetical protein
MTTISSSRWTPTLARPEAPDFLVQIQNADLVLGLRQKQGQRHQLALSRLLLSLSANAYARWISGLPLNDATGGQVFAGKCSAIDPWKQFE